MMKILQLNVWGGRLDRQVLQLLETEQPDIVCFQESVDLNGGNSGLFLTNDEIPESLELKYIFFSPVFTFKYMRRNMGFGNSILTKYPIQKQETIFTHLEHRDNFDLKDDSYNIRNLQHAVLQTSKGPLHILNHHGYHIHQHKNGDSETLRQTKLIADYVGKLDGPIILTGDFNLAPHSESLEQINAVLKNLSIEAKLKTTRNIFTHKTEVCDYIFINDAVKKKSFQASDELVSDHKALILEFDL